MAGAAGAVAAVAAVAVSNKERALTSRVTNTPPFFVTQSWMAICIQT